MRVFLAISVPEEVRALLTAATRRLAPVATDVTWCKRDQFHLTLAFLGDVSPAILPHVTAAADRIGATLPPFTCHVCGLGFFGTKRNPKTLWAGVTPTPELEALYAGLWQALGRFGFENGEDGFQPHITLGRCRESARNHPVIEAMDADEESDFGAWPVKRVTFYESRLTPHGPVYKALTHSAFTGA